MGMTVEQVTYVQRISQDPVAFETPVGEEEDSHLGDFIEDKVTPSPEEVVETMLLREQLLNILKTLTPREEKVIRLRFGFDDGRPRTLEEVGREFHVTRERIRQIETKALQKLRQPGRRKNLTDFVN